MQTERDSGFGYPLLYPDQGEIRLLFTIPKDDDRVILLDYPSVTTFRKVLRSQLHTLEPRTREYVQSKLPIIDSGEVDNATPLAVSVYREMSHEAS
ncbi:hypothetical protein [Salimicrobium album]|uniref:Uncharacterized protein n=1 Tax=Salimicrobium album TaxID=50717 RepID=A0A1H3DA64_9BACI|nr:hypothetical protein [Salimicrobium album]SDX63246.1 hypothetical protein SAMN04488081_0885 [Salimicrobium album]